MKINVRNLLVAVGFVALGLPSLSWAEDIDIYTDSGATTGVPNVLFVIDNGANFEANGGSTPCTAYNSGGAPSLGTSNGGIQQCALVNAIEALPNGTVNVGILVGNANNFAQGYSGMTAAHAAFYNTCAQNTGYGGCVLRPLTLMTAAAKVSLVNFIKSWKTTGQDSATEFNVKAGGNKTANMMQEAWAYYNAKTGMSGRTYTDTTLNTGCQKNFIIFVANAAGSSSTPADTPNAADAGAALAAAQVGSSAAQRLKISETARFSSTTCGVNQLAAGNQGSNWSSSWMDEWSRVMFQKDINSAGSGLQNIQTYAVGIIGAQCTPDYPALLTTAAKYGGGKYYSASGAVELTDALTSILNEIQAVNSVFSSASLPVSVNAQGTFLNQVFLGKFRPDSSARPRWLGNLKQYQFILVGDDPRTAELQLGDSTGAPAISSAGTGFITPGAVSFWTTDSATVRDTAVSSQISTGGFFINDVTRPEGRDTFDSPDGELVERGGAAQRLRIENLTATFDGAATAVGTSTNPRRLYTYCGAGTVCAATTPSNSLTNLNNELSTANANIPSNAFGDTTTITVSRLDRAGTVVTATTSSAHGFSAGNSVTISNSSEAAYNGTFTIATVPSTTTFTFPSSDKPTTPALGAYTFSTVGGASVSVSSLTRSTNTAGGNSSETVTVTTGGHAFTAGSSVQIVGASVSAYNGTWTIALPNTGACPAATCFTFSIPVYPIASSSGFSAVVAPTSVTVSAITSSANSGSGGTGAFATVTTSAAHGYHAGQRVNITSTGNSKYTVANAQVLSVLSSTSFTYQGYANGAPNSAAGGSVVPSTAAETVSLSRTATTDTFEVLATGATTNAFGRLVGDTKVINITKAANATTDGYTGSNITITCRNVGCTTFAYTRSISPASTPTGTITASTPSGGSVTIAAGGVTRVGTTTTVTGATANLFGTTAGQTNTINVSTSGTVFPDESAYVGSGSLPITCVNNTCTQFTYQVIQSPQVSVTTPNMQASVTGVSPDKNTLIKWLRGQDNVSNDELGPGGSVTVRTSIHGDVLHSRPVVINYGDSRGLVVYYGANDGVFRAVNGNKTTGSIGGVPPGGELWGLILPEHFSDLNRLRLNTPELRLPNTLLATARTKDYFVDGATGFYQKLNANGTINKAYLYLTMRRGGRFIYAIDVTEPTAPAVLWKKSYTDTGMEELGQTWSRPRVTLVKGYANPVIVFGAGYDPAEDAEPPQQGTMGRGIFVLDAETGALVWSAKSSSVATVCSGDSTQASCAVNGMNWAIPADISFVDRDNDGKTDRFYASDVGGNIWRVDLEPGTGTPTGTVNTWQVTQLAALGCTTGACAIGTTPRKFFFPPSVVSVGATLGGSSYDLVTISSGDREHPLKSTATGASFGVTNRFYAVKDFKTGKDAKSPSQNALITESSTFLFNAGTVGSLTNYNGSVSGFYVTFQTGEQAVNAPVTTRGTTFFGTNQPDDPDQTCSSNLGVARGYAVNPFTGSLDFSVFDGGGLPPSPTVGIVTIAVPGGPDVKRSFCVGCGSAVPPSTGEGDGDGTSSSIEAGELDIVVPKNPRRTYWFRR